MSPAAIVQRLAPPFDFNDESQTVQLAGCAGDILLFDVDLVHAGSLNPSGARRRSVLISYWAESLYASHLETLSLRSVRMDTTDRFEPSDFAYTSRPPSGIDKPALSHHHCPLLKNDSEALQ